MHTQRRVDMEFLPYNNNVQAFQPPFGHQNNHEYVLYADAFSIPRRSASMTNMNQVTMGGHPEKNDSKPRLSKGEVELLERQFQEQHKPTSNTKRQLAERMRVDISRINNWFQNRRAKAKQEKKQAEYGLRQANNLSYSEPSSPERFTPPGYTDPTQLPQNSVVPPFSGVSGPPLTATSYHPGHENLTTVAPMDPIPGAPYGAKAGQPPHQAGFAEECEGRRDNQFAMPMVFDGLPMGDRAPFPVPIHSGVPYSPDMFVVAGHNPVVMQDPSGADLYPYLVAMGDDGSAISESEVPFPSQILENGNGDFIPTPKPFESQELIPVKDESEEAPAPSENTESRLKSPPPPSNIAARRNKPKPTSLGTSAIRDRSSAGPKTTNNADGGKRMHGSPSSAMRRISSNGNLNVLGSRIQKHPNYMPQRSPLQRQFALGDTAAFLEKNAQSFNPTAAAASWFKPLDPPTPKSPRENQLFQKEDAAEKPDETASQVGSAIDDQAVSQDGRNSMSPPSREEPSYFSNHLTPLCFSTIGLNNMASPPETPANPQHPAPHWAFDVPDEPLRTPGFGISMHMPQPHYVSPLPCSQPSTPAFGQFTGFPYGHQSPIFDIAPLDPAVMDYYFPESSMIPYAMAASSKSPEQPREKIYTFNNATQKDFE